MSIIELMRWLRLISLNALGFTLAQLSSVEEAREVIDRASPAKGALQEAVDLLTGKLEAESMVEAAPILGKLYFFGKRALLRPDYPRALRFYLQGKDAESLYMASLCFSHGLGTPRSPAKVAQGLRG